MAVYPHYYTWTPALLSSEYLYRVMKFNNCSIPEEVSKHYITLNDCQVVFVGKLTDT